VLARKVDILATAKFMEWRPSMQAQFAGSRCLDERRRRRLALANDEPEAKENRSSSPKSKQSQATVSEMPSARSASHFPIRKALSQRWWKVWGIGLCVLALGGGTVAAGWWATQRPETLGPGFLHLFDWKNGRAARYLMTLHLLLASQLALFICWIRSGSLRDFAGRYRLWARSAAVGFVFAFLMATDAKTAWIRTVVWAWGDSLGAKEPFFWLAPVWIVGLIVLRVLLRDMRDCRSSVIVLWLSTLAWVVAAAMEFPLGLRIGEGQQMLVRAAAPMLGSCFLFVSMLLHARFVVYTSAEPPEPRPPRFRFPKMRLRLPSLLRRNDLDIGNPSCDSATQKNSRRRKKDRPAAPVADADSMEQDQAAGRTESRASGRKKKAANKKRSRKALTGTEEVGDAGGQSEAGQPQQAAQVDESSLVSKAKTHDIGMSAKHAQSGPDPSLLKGLSKRERRKLRQEWRAQQRVEQMQS
jgi:hypothetical protein